MILLQGQLESVARYLQSQRCDVGALRLWCFLSSWILLHASSEKTDSLLSDIEIFTVRSAKSLLHNVISARKFDFTLGVALLYFLGETFGPDWLQESIETFKQDHRKLGAVVQLGISCSFDNTVPQYYQMIALKCRWAEKLTQYKINYGIFVENSDQKISILNALMEKDISLVFKYCMDFELNIEESLFLCLRTLLQSWEPKYEVEKTVDGEESLIIEEIDSEIEKKCKIIIELIQNKIALARELDSILGEVNYYNYETYIYIIKLLEELSPEHNFISKKLLLSFLKDYKRIQPPNQEELNNWLESFPCFIHLPVISKWRLPFSPFMDNKKIWSTLQQELNLNTYKEWSKALDALNIQRDKIYSIAIKQSFRNRGMTTNETWNINSQDAFLLSQVEECVKNISNHEIASACLYFVTNHISPGIDQVTASELCYRRVLQWFEKDKACAKDYVARIESKYLHLSTTHILHKYGLAETCNLKLISDPHELMSSLFQHPSIVPRDRGTMLHCPGELFFIDLEFKILNHHYKCNQLYSHKLH